VTVGELVVAAATETAESKTKPQQLAAAAATIWASEILVVKIIKWEHPSRVANILITSQAHHNINE